MAAQAVAFLSVNVGFPHFLETGKPTLVSALHHLGGFPRRPPATFLRAAPGRIGRGAVVIVSANHSGLGRFFRVQAAYDLFPHKVYFGEGGAVATSVEHARSRGARYLILIRRNKSIAWPEVRSAHAMVHSGCCSLAALARQR